MSPRTTSRRTPPRSSTSATVRWTSNRSSCACRSTAPRRRRPSTIRSPTAETSWTSSGWPTGASSTAPTRNPTTSSSSSSPAAWPRAEEPQARTRPARARSAVHPRPCALVSCPARALVSRQHEGEVGVDLGMERVLRALAGTHVHPGAQPGRLEVRDGRRVGDRTDLAGAVAGLVGQRRAPGQACERRLHPHREAKGEEVRLHADHGLEEIAEALVAAESSIDLDQARGPSIRAELDRVPRVAEVEGREREARQTLQALALRARPVGRREVALDEEARRERVDLLGDAKAAHL